MSSLDFEEIGKRVVEATGRYARLVLRLPDSGDELEMDLLKEALGPGGITVQLATCLGRPLSVGRASCGSV